MTEIYILNNNSNFAKNIETILLKQYNIINSRINHDKFGKPFINNSYLCISISYSKKINLFAISKSQIGVDIEEIKETYPKLICKVFTDNEKEYINKGKDEEVYRFYNIWCCKEAIGKLLGVGLQYPTRNICTVKQKKIKKHLKVNNTYNKVYLNSYCFMNHVIVLCSESDQILIKNLM